MPSSQQRVSLYLGHMLDSARKVAAKVAGIDRAAFDADENLRYALVHLLQTIGEAARHIPQDFRDSHSAIPWNAIIGMRHRLVHDYLGVDENIVWRTATQEMAGLISRLEKLIQTESS